MISKELINKILFLDINNKNKTYSIFIAILPFTNKIIYLLSETFFKPVLNITLYPNNPVTIKQHAFKSFIIMLTTKVWVLKMLNG